MEFSHPIISFVENLCVKDNITCCLVGGSVRDIFLKRDFVDFDFVLEENAVDFVKHHFKGSPIVAHKRFMTASVQFRGHRLDFATARKETYEYCGAMPVVGPAPIEEDMARRDFTINAMAISLGSGRFYGLKGGIIDPFNGRIDIERRVLDVTYEKSFCDDPIRVLRGIRLKRRLGFDFSSRCYEMIKEVREKKYMLNVPKERVRDEVFLSLTEQMPGAIFQEEISLLGKEWLSEELDEYMLSHAGNIKHFFLSMPKKEAARVIKEFKFPHKFLKDLI